MASFLPYKKAIAVDTETDGFNTHDGHRPFLAILYSDDAPPHLVWEDDPEAEAKIRSVLEDPECIKVGWNLPFDWRMIQARWNIVPVWPWFDAQVAMSMLDEKAFPFRLKQCAAAYLKENTSTASVIADWLAHNKSKFKLEHGREPNYKDIPRNMMAEYCADDGKYTLKFYYLLQGGLERSGMLGAFDTEMRLIPALVDMHDEGIPVDVDHLEAERIKAYGMINYQYRKIEEEVGYRPNISSPKQVSELMYGRLGIKCADFTDSGAPSSGKIALKRHARANPTVARIKRIRQLEGVAKMCVTLQESRRLDGLLHPTQNQCGARTGRMSMNDPNLQNLTREGTVKGFSIRSAFVPPVGWRQFHTDYKQVEMVDFADYSQDPVMCNAIRQGVDVHTVTAKRILQMQGHEREPTPEERQQAKTCNFAIIYGSGDATFADTLNLDDSIDRLFTVGEARHLRLMYLQGFPGVDMLKEKVAYQIGRFGKLTDRFGRIHRLSSSEWYKGINWLVQGGCGTLLKRAIIRMHACADWWNHWYAIHAEMKNSWTKPNLGPIVKLVLTVHDEIAFKIRAELEDHMIRTIVETMVSAMTGDRTLYDIPLRADVEELKPDWGHAEKFEISKELPWQHPASIAGDSKVWDAGGVGKWWRPLQTA